VLRAQTFSEFKSSSVRAAAHRSAGTKPVFSARKPM
jgi:hypothetical protein